MSARLTLATLILLAMFGCRTERDDPDSGVRKDIGPRDGDVDIPLDAGVAIDATARDADAHDAGEVEDASNPIEDAAVEDAAGEDSAALDAQSADADTADALVQLDAEVEDTGAPDAGAIDAGRGTDAGARIWANTQWPPFATLAPSASRLAYGRIWIDGLTNRAGATPNLTAELGVGPAGVDPADSSWSWTPASFNVDVGNNDEVVATLTAPTSGAWDYAFRYRLGGTTPWPSWLYADRGDNGRVGTDDGYSSANAAKLAVRAPPAELRVATLNVHCFDDDPNARLDAAIARFAALEIDLLALQEVCLDRATGAAIPDQAQYVAEQLSNTTGRVYWSTFAETHLANGTTPEGVAIVSALPLADVVVHPLPAGDFARKTIVAIVAAPVGMVAFATAHLSFRAIDAQARIDQTNAIVALLDTYTTDRIAAHIVAGDFNSEPAEAPHAAMVQAGFTDVWSAAHPAENGFTFPSTSPTRRIDYLFVRVGTPGPLDVGGSTIEFDQPYAPSAYVSDHRGISATLRAP